MNFTVLDSHAMTAIGLFLPIMVTKRADQIRRSRCSVRMHITGQVECNFAITRAFFSTL